MQVNFTKLQVDARKSPNYFQYTHALMNNILYIPEHSIGGKVVSRISDHWILKIFSLANSEILNMNSDLCFTQ